jgi:hypothetical protein
MIDGRFEKGSRFLFPTPHLFSKTGFAFSLHAVLVDCLLQAAILRRLGHLWQGLQDLVLG